LGYEKTEGKNKSDTNPNRIELARVSQEILKVKLVMGLEN